VEPCSLTLGLTQHWGEVYPRGVPFLRGKPVRPRTAIIPATVVAILVTSAGMAYLRAMLTDRSPWTGDPAPHSCGRCGELPWAPPLSPTTCAAAAAAATAIDHELKPSCRLPAVLSSLGWGGVVPPTSSMSVVRLSPLPQNSNKRRGAFPDQLPPVEGSPLVAHADWLIDLGPGAGS
jgi:hypothetical protein